MLYAAQLVKFLGLALITICVYRKCKINYTCAAVEYLQNIYFNNVLDASQGFCCCC